MKIDDKYTTEYVDLVRDRVLEIAAKEPHGSTKDTRAVRLEMDQFCWLLILMKDVIINLPAGKEDLVYNCFQGIDAMLSIYDTYIEGEPVITYN
jgi:uncharacterized protein (UPF0305 family)